jgi:endonuclease/exonuclease/phosphatase family metal-dependent hydrolase
VRVASYNVHACRGRDGRQDVERIAAVLREIDADLIGLQEVECREGRSLVDQAARLAAALAMHLVEGPVLRVGSGWYGNAVLTRWPPIWKRNVGFEHHGREARGAVICEVPTPDEVLWRVISTHLDLRRRSRRRQLEALLQGLTASSPGPVVLLGDFNEWWPYSGNLTVLRRHLCLPLAPATFPSGIPVLCLDRIAFLGCRLRDRIQRHDTPQSRVASDHLPIWADLIAAT